MVYAAPAPVGQAIGLARPAFDQPVKDSMNPRSSNPTDEGYRRRFAPSVLTVGRFAFRAVLVAEGFTVRR